MPAAKERAQCVNLSVYETHKSQGLIIVIVAMETLAQFVKEKLTELHNHALMYFAQYQVECLEITNKQHESLQSVFLDITSV